MVYGFQYNAGPFQKLRNDARLPAVKKVVQGNGNDLEGIFSGVTSLSCYEPMFGYRLEALKAQLVVGSSSLIRDDN